jgi:hypothetical protein
VISRVVEQVKELPTAVGSLFGGEGNGGNGGSGNGNS